MPTRKLILAGIVTLMAAGALTPGFAYETGPRARLIALKGVVKIQRGGRGTWFRVTAPAHRQLFAGDHVQTLQNSGATIVIDNVPINLGPATHVTVPAASKARARRSPASLLWVVAGRVFIWLVGSRYLELGSEAASAAAEGTKFVFEVGPDGTTTLTVLEGQVRFGNDLGQVICRASEQSAARRGSAPSTPMRVDPSGYIQWEAEIQSFWSGWEVRWQPAASREQLQQAETEVARAAIASPATAAAWSRLGDLRHDLGDGTGAEDAYRSALQAEPDNAHARLGLGYSLLQQARARESAQAFTAAAAADPAGAAPLVGLAAALTAGGSPDDLAAADQALARAAAVPPAGALVRTMAGLLAIRRGQADLARTALQEAVGQDATAYQAHALLALVELSAGNQAAALAAARQAVALAPSSAMAHESLAHVLFFSGDSAAARTETELALTVAPNSATSHLLLSDLLVVSGDLDGGLREARLSIACDANFGPAYSALGMLCLAQNNLKHAEVAFTTATQLTPRLVAARTGLGQTYARQGKLAAALEAQKAAIALDSSAAAAHNNIGAIHLALGRLPDAVAEFQQAIEAQPKWSMPHANLALAYLDLNQYAAAVHEAELAVQLGERSARVYTTLARVYLKQNRDNKAQAALRRAIELDESYALAHLEMAEAYVRQGRSRDAIRHQLRGVALQPSAMVETREYARTEVSLAAGSFAGDIRRDGRGDDGQNSYYLRAAHENDNWNRQHSSWTNTQVLGLAGRQTDASRADVLYLSASREAQDRPGKLLASGLPEDADWRTTFEGRDFKYLSRRTSTPLTTWTYKLGYSDSWLQDDNPDSLAPDPKPFPVLRLRSKGPTAEVRLDHRLGPSTNLMAGAAFFGESQEVTGVVGTPPALGTTDPVKWTSFGDTANADAGTFYLRHTARIDRGTSLMLGGRLATRRGMTPVLRPEATLRRQAGQDGTLVLLTRAIMRDDVSELAAVDDWGLRDWMSPLDLASGGFSQSYELQYELMPANGSVLRLSAFERRLRNYKVNLDDPRWAVGKIGMVLASGTLRGGEIEWEHWLGRDLSAGLWVRYTDSKNDEAGGQQIPYQPRLSGQLRLDYIDAHGVRVGLQWLHVGERYADLANLTKLGSYNLVNLRAEKQLNLHSSLFLGVDNVLDQAYGFYQAYPGRERKVRAGVECRF